MAATSSRSPFTGIAPASRTLSAELSERAMALTVHPSETRRRISAPPMKPDPPVTKAVGTGLRYPGCAPRAHVRRILERVVGKRVQFDAERQLDQAVRQPDVLG